MNKTCYYFELAIFPIACRAEVIARGKEDAVRILQTSLVDFFTGNLRPVQIVYEELTLSCYFQTEDCGLAYLGVFVNDSEINVGHIVDLEDVE